MATDPGLFLLFYFIGSFMDSGATLFPIFTKNNCVRRTALSWRRQHTCELKITLGAGLSLVKVKDFFFPSIKEVFKSHYSERCQLLKCWAAFKVGGQ